MVGFIVHHLAPAIVILCVFLYHQPQSFSDLVIDLVVLDQQQPAGKTVLILGQGSGPGRVGVVAGDVDHPGGVLINGQKGHVRKVVYNAGKTLPVFPGFRITPEPILGPVW